MKNQTTEGKTMNVAQNNSINKKLGFGYLSQAFTNAGIDNSPHPNSRIREYKYDIINLGTLKNVIPTAVLRKTLFNDTFFSRRKQSGYKNILIKNDSPLYEVVSELAHNFYGDYSYFAPFKIRFRTLNTEFFADRLKSRPVNIKNIDRNLPFTRIHFPRNLSNTNSITGGFGYSNFTPVSVQNNIINSNYFISGYNSGINYSGRNNFIYRVIGNQSGYIPYPNTVVAWQYSPFKLDTVMTLNSVDTYQGMYDDMKGLLTVSLNSENTSNIVYVSPHGVANKFLNSFVETLRLQPAKVQPKVVGLPPKFEYVIINSGIIINVLDIDSEYYKNSITPTPFVGFSRPNPFINPRIPANALTGITSVIQERDNSFGDRVFKIDTYINSQNWNTGTLRQWTVSPKIETINGTDIRTQFRIVCGAGFSNLGSGDLCAICHGLPIKSSNDSLMITGWEWIWRKYSGISSSETLNTWSLGPIMTNLMRSYQDAAQCYYQISPNTKNRILITNPELGLRIGVSGCYGGFESKWETSKDGFSWSGFDMYLTYSPITGYTYNGSPFFGPETVYPSGYRQDRTPADCNKIRFYSGQVPLNHKFLRVVNPIGDGGGNISLSVGAYTGQNVFDEGLYLNETGSGQNPLSKDFYKVKNILQQKTPLKDTWFYKFYSGLYTGNKTLATGVWNGTIPSGYSVTVEYIATKDHYMGTNNEFKFVYKNYGDDSFIDRIVRSTFANPSVISGDQQFYPPVIKRGFGMSPDSLKDAVFLSNSNLRKNINLIYNQFDKITAAYDIETRRVPSKVRKLRRFLSNSPKPNPGPGLVSTSTNTPIITGSWDLSIDPSTGISSQFNYRTINDIPAGIYGCFKLEDKSIVCINP